MTSWVRQYTLRDILDDSFDLFKERASTLMVVGLLPYTFVALYMAVMRLFVIPGNFTTHPFTVPSSLPYRDLWQMILFGLAAAIGTTPEDLQTLLSSPLFWLFIFGFLVVWSLAASISYLAQCRVAGYHALGLPITVRDAFRRLAKPFFSFVVVGFVYLIVNAVVSSVASAILFPILVVVGVLVGASMAMGYIGVLIAILVYLLIISVFAAIQVIITVFFLSAPVALAVEHCGPFTALGKGFTYGGSNFWKQAFALYALLHLPLLLLPIIVWLAMLVSGISGFVSPSLTMSIVYALVLGVGTVAFVGLLSCFQTLAYLDGRSRHDAFDLLLLAREIGLGAEMEQLMLRKPAATPVAAAPVYPNYLETPPPAVTPNYTAPPAPAAGAGQVQGLTPPTAPTGYPDYSAPPPSLDDVEIELHDTAPALGPGAESAPAEVPDAR